MKISVVYAGEMIHDWQSFDVADEVTVEEAISQSGILAKFPEINLSARKVGIFGKATSLKSLVKAGDRIEIYRKITRVFDPEDDDDED